ncbi:hypothetical protein DZF91_34525 [Actinomadura logoneensis]|uniref:Bifunctional folylpolyglutamate synthase/dihydrofolate synthase n=1 Tax=Actinomadura logoneensis TaxID=2293572 RepID=A0A372JAU5_9ACTN|nr:hypothetical protein [Actinomadura logoneensis]RFU37117.1 hypothetical protein DZF91_34525 [Actinomadura logoneensis]
MAADQVFFREWTARRPGSRRSVVRARALAEALGSPALGSPPGDVPVLAVVGSKGKGTAATYAAATLAAAGLRVVSVMSPGHRSNRDRIRVDGRALSPAEFASLASRLAAAMETLPPPTPPSDGYLSPAGLFTLAGLVHARDVGADVVVLEAGMGGGSDEISLFPATVVAVTPIFAEHVGVLGDTVEEIAAEKAAVIVPETRAVVSAPQSDEVTAVLDAFGDVDVAVDDSWDGLLPPGLGRANARTGLLAGLRMAEVLGRPPADARLREVLRTVVLPGRLSPHERDGIEVLADSAINRTGVAAAVEAARARWGTVDHVLVCLPDHKDLDGAIAELDGLPVTFVRLPQAHLRFTRPLPSSWDVLDAAELSMEALAARGRHLLAVGTVYFVGLLLDVLDADVERLFVP